MPRKLLPAISLALLYLPSAFGKDEGACGLTKRANATASEQDIWGGITPNRTLTWHPCYADAGKFQCSRFEVPLDYSQPDGRQAAIALVRKRATVQEGYRGPILFNPGGPGVSGVSMILSLGDALAQVVGPQFDVVGFDPRGVARSTPRASFFKTDVERALYDAGSGAPPVVKDGVVTGIESLWARSQLLGTLAANNNDGFLQHITTENTATDMLRIVQAHGQEKIQYWGVSYGTVLGATFAAMYPDKIERLIIDGVADADDYYSAAWLSSLADSDKTLQLFFDGCAEAGPDGCPFYAPDPADIQRNYTALEDKLRAEPVVVKTDTFYGIVDQPLLRFTVFQTLYSPYTLFQPLANALAQLAAGNGTALLSLLHDPSPYTCSCDPTEHAWDELNDGTVAIGCNDGAEISGSLSDLKDYWKQLAGTSQFSDYWGTIHSSCINWPKNKKPFHGPFVGNTSHPILLIGNTADPATPLASAKKMAKGFKDAVVLTIDAGGHTSLNAPSLCAQQYVQQYFQNGTLPEEGTICQPIAKNPFAAGTSSEEGSLSARDESTGLLRVLEGAAGKINHFVKHRR